MEQKKNVLRKRKKLKRCWGQNINVKKVEGKGMTTCFFLASYMATPFPTDGKA